MEHRLRRVRVWISRVIVCLAGCSSALACSSGDVDDGPRDAGRADGQDADVQDASAQDEPDVWMDGASEAQTPSVRSSTPEFSPAEGPYPGNVKVSIESATPDAMIYLTLDGSDPTFDSPAYVGPFTIETTTTVKAFADAAGYLPSELASATYSIDAAAAPLFLPPAGAYAESVTVAISSATPGASIAYTLDGSDPGVHSPAYTGELTFTSTTVLRAIAIHPSYEPSSNTTATYTVLDRAAPPTIEISPPIDCGGQPIWCGTQEVTMATTTAGGQIHFTQDGSEPTSTSELYGGPVYVWSSAMFRAITVAPGFAPSEETAAAFDVWTSCDGWLPPPFFSPSGGVHCTCVDVEISVFAPGATINYTTDGSVPTETSPAYTGPITICSTTTLRAQARAPGWCESQVSTAVYAIGEPHCAPPGPAIEPPGGSFSNPIEVKLTPTDPTSVILYTLDGSAPEPGVGSVYGGPFTLSYDAVVSASEWPPGQPGSLVTTATFTFP